LKKGDKVVITTRFYDDPILEEHVNALQSRGIQVRIVGRQNDKTKERQGVEDFCFLLRAKKELVGSARSTFALWAAVLGQAENIRLYTIKSPALKFRFGPFIKMFFAGNYTWNLADGQKRLQMVLLPMDRTRIG
jgi:hypothetical protein